MDFVGSYKIFFSKIEEFICVFTAQTMKKYLMENFTFCAVTAICDCTRLAGLFLPKCEISIYSKLYLSFIYAKINKKPDW